MSLTIKKEHVPMQKDTDGVVRVGETRVTLDTVIAVFKEGATPEEIVYRYPSLRLPDVYAVISYYLHHSQEVEVYLSQRNLESNQIRVQNQARFDSTGIRERLLARQAKTG